MSEVTKIEWTDASFNPWIGCSKVAGHHGCTFCYAEADMDTRRGRVKWGPHGTRSRTSDAYWKEPLKWNREAAKAGERRKVFCASLADVFEDWQGPIIDAKGQQLWFQWEGGPHYFPDYEVTLGARETMRLATMSDLRRDLFALIDQTPNLDWLLLTKRPENVLRMWPLVSDGTDSGEKDEKYYPNVWLGTSISDQKTADEWLPRLLTCRALVPVLFLSVEPLLGPVDLKDYLPGLTALRREPLDNDPWESQVVSEMPSIDWCIAGGESGPHARPMHPQWARGLRDQCLGAGTAFFMKQWGEWLPGSQVGSLFTDDELARHLVTRAETPEGPGTAISYCFKVGKKAAGRLLDGREWNQFPERRPA